VERLLEEVWIAEAVHRDTADAMADVCCLERSQILTFDAEAHHFKPAFALAIWPSRKQVRQSITVAQGTSKSQRNTRLSSNFGFALLTSDGFNRHSHSTIPMPLSRIEWYVCSLSCAQYIFSPNFVQYVCSLSCVQFILCTVYMFSTKCGRRTYTVLRIFCHSLQRKRYYFTLNCQVWS
jgi:hypothetical protein